MTHHASPDFWRRYDALPQSVRALGDKNFELLKANPRHPSLHFKQVGRFRSVRVGLSCRSGREPNRKKNLAPVCDDNALLAALIEHVLR